MNEETGQNKVGKRLFLPCFLMTGRAEQSTSEMKFPYNKPKRGDFSMFQIETISAKMLDYYVERSDAMIIDLRDPESYRKGHVRSAVNIPYKELEECSFQNQCKLPDKIIVFYCDRGGASMKAARIFARQGHRTRSVIGGFAAYRGRNLVG